MQLTVKATIRLLNWKAFLRIVIDIGVIVDLLQQYKQKDLNSDWTYIYS